MKRSFLSAAAAFIFIAGTGNAQAPGAQSPIEKLKAIRDQNVKLIEQQAKTIQQLEALEKEAQTLKVLGKRS